MQPSQFTLDTENLRKALPLALLLAGGLGILTFIIDFLGGVWGIILLAGWAYIGAHYVNTVLASGQKAQVLSLGINAAILAAAGGIAYDLVSWVVLGLRFSDVTGNSPISLYFVEAGLIGGLAALAWYAYKTSST
jgi:hypothetical protein